MSKKYNRFEISAQICFAQKCLDINKSAVQKIIALLNEKKITQKALAKYLGIQLNTISGWLSGKHKISLKNIYKIANYLDVSVDYLLGLQEAKTQDKDLSFICEYLNLDEQLVMGIKRLTEKPFYREMIEYLMKNDSASSNVVNTGASKLQQLFHLIAEIDVDLAGQIDKADRIKKELVLAEVENLTCQNEYYKKFWELDKQVIINTFQIQEKIKEFIRDFEKDKLQAIDDFKAVIPLPDVYTSVEHER